MKSWSRKFIWFPVAVKFLENYLSFLDIFDFLLFCARDNLFAIHVDAKHFFIFDIENGAKSLKNYINLKVNAKGQTRIIYVILEYSHQRHNRKNIDESKLMTYISKLHDSKTNKTSSESGE